MSDEAPYFLILGRILQTHDVIEELKLLHVKQLLSHAKNAEQLPFIMQE